jgi:hypothetical protein
MADRIRFDFFGTSNQTAGGAPRVWPIANELGIAHLVVEQPARLDYLDALAVLRQAGAVLLLGSSEPHYTASKIFPALLANRPLLAAYHAASTAVGMLRDAAPSARIVTFDERHPVETTIPCLMDALRSVANSPASDVTINRHVIEPWSARVLAGRLAAICDQVAA